MAYSDAYVKTCKIEYIPWCVIKIVVQNSYMLEGKKIFIHKIFISIKNGMEMTKKDKRDSNICTKVIIYWQLFFCINAHLSRKAKAVN